MGRPGQGNKTISVLSEERNEKSIVKFRGENEISSMRLMKPNLNEINDNTEETKRALEKLISGKIKATTRSINTTSTTQFNEDAKYIRYTPTDPISNKPKQQRIIKLVEAPVDPLEPPKFKHKKVPAGPPSPPAAVLHSPPRKVTAQDQLNWKIPPCVSNWKNAKGYTIPLDKRLAADGRGLLEPTINEKFAQFAEAMQVSYNISREAVKDRNQLAKKLKVKEREDEEDKLRKLAQEAREKRAGVRPNATVSKEEREKELARMSEKERKEYLEREELRMERTKERQKDMLLEAKGKKAKTTHEHERDISEKIALGLPIGKTALQNRYDERLFNQSSGIDSGFGDEDDYSIYTKPLFSEKNEGIFKPRVEQDNAQESEDLYNKLKNSNKFIPDKSFAGADVKSTGSRNGPVEVLFIYIIV